MSSDDRTRDPLGIGPRLKELDRRLKAADLEAAHLEYTQLKAENARLRGLLEIAADACRERAITPHLIDVLDAEGYETAPPEPEPDVWLPRAHEHEPGEWHTHPTSGPHAHPYGDER